MNSLPTRIAGHAVAPKTATANRIVGTRAHNTSRIAGR